MNVVKLMAAAAIGLAAAPSSAANFEGATVSAALYCCVAPTDPYRVSDVLSETVDDLVEFPVSSFTFVSDGTTWDEGEIDIGASSIRLDLYDSGVTRSGTFNGFVFSFSQAPVIAQVSVDPTSTVVPTTVSFTENSVLLHVSDVPYVAGDHLTLNVVFAPVPEAGPGALLAAGLLLLVGRVRSRRSRAGR